MRFTNQQKYSLGWENFNFSNFYNFISDLGEKALGRQGVNGATTIKEPGSGSSLFAFPLYFVNTWFSVLVFRNCVLPNKSFQCLFINDGWRKKKVF